MRSYGLSIDIGGTFTDVVLHDASGAKLLSRKELTTYDNPSRGVLAGVDTLLDDAGAEAAEVDRVIHATTLFTNALLERRGARTGLITTRGFRDVLEIGREDRYELYNLNYRRPDPLVPRDLRREVGERIDRGGRVRIPLDGAELLAEAGALVAAGVEAIAIVFLHSYRSPEHEIAAARALAEAYPDIAISYSHEVVPVIREYERTSSTVANAYVKPLATAYLDRLAGGLAGRGIGAPIKMMLSSGGLTSLEDTQACPIKVLEAGPAAGVIAAARFGEDSGRGDLLAFDMGGTTAKLCVVHDGKPKTAQSFEAARQERFMKGSGLPILVPTIELIEIGAGGGSIASINDLGLLKVGPQSAGSTPGPACYGLGRNQATVTDANFHLGFLSPERFAGGRIAIDLDAARASLETLGAAGGLDAARAAWGIFDVVNETMASAARVHIAEQGLDPRRSLLVATGGGGPLHGYYVGRKIGVGQVLCPALAGVASAIGLLCAPMRVERAQSVVTPYDMIDWAAVDDTLDELTATASTVLSPEDPGTAALQVSREADLRYSGQTSTVTVPLPETLLTRQEPESIRELFRRTYRARFTGAPESGRVELANLRVVVTLNAGARADLGTPEAAGADAPARSRPVYFTEADGYLDTPVWTRADLVPGREGAGPAIIEDPLSTVLVGPRARFSLTPEGHVLIDLGIDGED